jgi:hypothetical protein
MRVKKGNRHKRMGKERVKVCKHKKRHREIHLGWAVKVEEQQRILKERRK